LGSADDWSTLSSGRLILGIVWVSPRALLDVKSKEHDSAALVLTNSKEQTPVDKLIVAQLVKKLCTFMETEIYYRLDKSP
jgi:hypothetical protein